MDESISPVPSPRPLPPTRRLPPLASLRAFEAAARHQSFQRAAAELSVTPTAISHQVRGLEATLGRPLFKRLTRQLVLTPAGASLARALRDGFDTIEAGLAAFRTPAPANTVTLSASTAFCARWLLPRMADFHRACPGMALRLQATDALADLAHGDADLAIRSGLGPWPGVHSAVLMQEHYAPVCSAALGAVRPHALRDQRLIHFDWQPQAHQPATWKRWFKEAGLPMPRRASPEALSFTDETHAIMATQGGQGIGLVSLTLVAEELRCGALLQPFGPVLAAGAYHLVVLPGREAEPAIQAVWRWLTSQANAAPGRTPAPPRRRASRRNE